ncbi:MAG TPA: FecR family protein [Kofleriaceae bacterium]
MKPTLTPEALTDELAQLAGRAEPPTLADGEVRWMIDRAIDEAASPTARSHGRTAWHALPLAALAAAAIAFVVRARPVAVDSHDAQVMHLTLPTGDRLTGVAGARFDVEQLAASDRRLRLHSGLVLFDVAHVVPGQRFSVATPQLVAIAKGTVFSVETDAIGSRVRVYEGVVEVEQGGEQHDLAAGSVWDSATHQTAIALARPASLATTIATALDERAAAPVEAPAPAPAPAATATAMIAQAPAPASPPEPTPIAPAAPAMPDLHLAQSALTDGKLEHALELAKQATTIDGATAAWWLVLADAQRGLGNASDAADAYDRAARMQAGAERAEAGYSAAYVRLHELNEPVLALSSLIAAHADDDGSPLEERALGLRAEILVALGRKHEAADVATSYLAKFPKADLHAYMTALTR